MELSVVTNEEDGINYFHSFCEHLTLHTIPVKYTRGKMIIEINILDVFPCCVVAGHYRRN